MSGVSRRGRDLVESKSRSFSLERGILNPKNVNGGSTYGRLPIESISLTTLYLYSAAPFSTHSPTVVAMFESISDMSK